MTEQQWTEVTKMTLADEVRRLRAEVEVLKADSLDLSAKLLNTLIREEKAEARVRDLEEITENHCKPAMEFLIKAENLLDWVTAELEFYAPGMPFAEAILARIRKGLGDPE